MDTVKVTAWVSWIIQLLNAFVALLSNIPAESTGAVQLVGNGQSKQLILQTVIAVGFGLLQGFLPRLQKKK